MRHMEFTSSFNVVTMNVIPSDSQKYVLVHHHPLFRQLIETRPIFLEDHLCALRLFRVDPGLRRVIGKP